MLKNRELREQLSELSFSQEMINMAMNGEKIKAIYSIQNRIGEILIGNLTKKGRQQCKRFFNLLLDIGQLETPERHSNNLTNTEECDDPNIQSNNMTINHIQTSTNIVDLQESMSKNNHMSNFLFDLKSCLEVVEIAGKKETLQELKIKIEDLQINKEFGWRQQIVNFEIIHEIILKEEAVLQKSVDTYSFADSWNDNRSKRGENISEYENEILKYRKLEEHYERIYNARRNDDINRNLDEHDLREKYKYHPIDPEYYKHIQGAELKNLYVTIRNDDSASRSSYENYLQSKNNDKLCNIPDLPRKNNLGENICEEIQNVNRNYENIIRILHENQSQQLNEKERIYETMNENFEKAKNTNLERVHDANRNYTTKISEEDKFLQLWKKNRSYHQMSTPGNENIEETQSGNLDKKANKSDKNVTTITDKNHSPEQLERKKLYKKTESKAGEELKDRRVVDCRTYKSTRKYSSTKEKPSENKFLELWAKNRSYKMTNAPNVNSNFKETKVNHSRGRVEIADKIKRCSRNKQESYRKSINSDTPSRLVIQNKFCEDFETTESDENSEKVCEEPKVIVID